jgi:hypothetical protein
MVTSLLSTDSCWFEDIVHDWKSLSVDARVCLAMDSCWLEELVHGGKLRENHVSWYSGPIA